MQSGEICSARFSILGPLLVQGDTRMISPVRRAVLTALLLRTGRPITISEFAELLWDEPPASATANIRSHLTGLRRDLDGSQRGLSERLHTYRGGHCGYRLHIEPDELDLTRFAKAARTGRTHLLCGDLDAAIASLEEAITLWRGPFGQDLPPTRWFSAHVAGLNNARFDAYQDLFTACILADHTAVLGYQIESAIAEVPYRQRFWELLAAVHCIKGDASSALDVIKRCQALFADDLGLDLPPGIEAMRAAALTWDSRKAWRLVAASVQSPRAEDGSRLS